MIATLAPSSAVVWLDDLTIDDATIVGGKGANLGELTAAGFRVPEGFVVTRAGVPRRRWRPPASARRIADLASAENLDQADVEATREFVAVTSSRQAGIPDATKREIVEAYRRLGDDVVRRGAVVGDRRGLGDDVVRGDERVVHQRLGRGSARRPRRRLLGVLVRHACLHLSSGPARRCRARDRRRRTTHGRRRRSGVMFTADPTSGDRSRIVIEAAARTRRGRGRGAGRARHLRRRQGQPGRSSARTVGPRRSRSCAAPSGHDARVGPRSRDAATRPS